MFFDIIVSSPREMEGRHFGRPSVRVEIEKGVEQMMIAVVFSIIVVLALFFFPILKTVLKNASSEQEENKGFIIVSVVWVLTCGLCITAVFLAIIGPLWQTQQGVADMRALVETKCAASAGAPAVNGAAPASCTLEEGILNSTQVYEDCRSETANARAAAMARVEGVARAIESSARF
ncbi:hypothetical protein KBD18_01300, partial [Patescibacteria group bacterium]|nr:hypothetical protein [Patescibacteria group bacterium]